MKSRIFELFIGGKWARGEHNRGEHNKTRPVPILPFNDENEVLELANAVDFGLSGYFFTRNPERQRKFSAGLQVGTVGINDTPIHVAEIPPGGWKDSDDGVEGGIEMLSAYLQNKFIHTRHI